MTLQNTDILYVERGGVPYKLNASELNEFINAGQDLTALTFADLQSGTFIGGAAAEIGNKVFINDASGDPTVDAGFAIYRISSISPLLFDKIQEGESLDITINPSNLSYTPQPAGGLVDNTNGDGFSIPLADATNAGLMSPTQVGNSHPKAFANNPTANPIIVDPNTQEITFSISQLAELP